MHIVPVIDIMHAQVVRGVAGRRDEYRPISSPLCASAEPVDVLAAFRQLYPFDVLYVADLDGIERGRTNVAVLDALHAVSPEADIWLDAGAAEVSNLSQLRGRGWIRPVLGSESQHSLQSFAALRSAADGEGLGAPLLSLDFDADKFLGPAALLEHRDAWPADVIVMTLDRVGVNEGPGLARLEAIRREDLSGRKFYAAGGLRGPQDLPALESAGCAGVLVASALHDGKLTGADIAAA